MHNEGTATEEAEACNEANIPKVVLGYIGMG